MIGPGEDVLDAPAQQRTEAVRRAGRDLHVHVRPREHGELVDVAAVRQVHRRQVPVIRGHAVEEPEAQAQVRRLHRARVRRRHPQPVRGVEDGRVEVRLARLAVGLDRECADERALQGPWLRAISSGVTWRSAFASSQGTVSAASSRRAAISTSISLPRTA